MNNYWYLLALIVSLCGIVTYDLTHTKNIFLGKKFLIPIFASMLILLASDIIGINFNIFHTNPAFVSGLFIISPDMPIEELLLLFFLPYFTIVLHSAITLKKPA